VPPILYTSGTTGFPKAVEFPVPMFARSATLGEHLEALDRNRFTAYENHLVVGPLHHTGPLNGMRSLAGGTRLVVLGRFDAERTLAAIEEHVERVEVAVRAGEPIEVPAKLDAAQLEALRRRVEDALVGMHADLDAVTGYRDPEPLRLPRKDPDAASMTAVRGASSAPPSD
jgi:acyl-CoA synthetase (AMP-forming)/AMP-acid ligase II